MKSMLPQAIFLSLVMFCFCLSILCAAEDGPRRARDWGLRFGDLPTGKLNAITDVPGVLVGHVTLIEGSDVRTGVTAVLPHAGNLFQEKVPGAIYAFNGFGKLAGYTQVAELGQIETPIMMTNTLSIGAVMEGTIRHMLSLPGNEKVQSVNAVVGECNDGYLSDIRGLHVRPEHAIEAIRKAAGGPVAEGSVGAGTGTTCMGFKAGIGTSSRLVSIGEAAYSLGVLVQTNFGGLLHLEGVPVGNQLHDVAYKKEPPVGASGSCIIVVATDAPLDATNLLRLAKRSMLGLGKTGGISGSTSGEYIIAFSTAPELRIKLGSAKTGAPVLSHGYLNTLFVAVIDATEEAIINSIFAAKTTTGREGHKVNALPIDRALESLKNYRH